MYSYRFRAVVTCLPKDQAAVQHRSAEAKVCTCAHGGIFHTPWLGNSLCSLWIHMDYQTRGKQSRVKPQLQQKLRFLWSSHKVTEYDFDCFNLPEKLWNTICLTLGLKQLLKVLVVKCVQGKSYAVSIKSTSSFRGLSFSGLFTVQKASVLGICSDASVLKEGAWTLLPPPRHRTPSLVQSPLSSGLIRSYF